MLRSASRSPLALGFVLAAVLGATACTPIVTGGPDGTGGAVNGDVTSTTTGVTSGPFPPGEGGGPPVPVAVNAIALPYVLVAGGQGGGGSTPPDGTSGVGGAGGGIDPNTLYVQVANFAQTCSEAPTPYCDGQLAWQVSVGIPPALQVPGVIQLSDSSLISTFSESLSDALNPSDCGGGGGSFVEGTIEILTIDQSTVVVKLSGTNGGVTDFDADGVYTAPICPTGV